MQRQAVKSAGVAVVLTLFLAGCSSGDEAEAKKFAVSIHFVARPGGDGRMISDDSAACAPSADSRWAYLEPGAPVVITDAKGKTLGETSLPQGRLDGVLDDGTIKCDWFIYPVDVDEASSYTVEVSGNGLGTTPGPEVELDLLSVDIEA